MRKKRRREISVTEFRTLIEFSPIFRERTISRARVHLRMATRERSVRLRNAGKRKASHRSQNRGAGEPRRSKRDEKCREHDIKRFTSRASRECTRQQQQFCAQRVPRNGADRTPENAREDTPHHPQRHELPFAPST